MYTKQQLLAGIATIVVLSASFVTPTFASYHHYSSWRGNRNYNRSKGNGDWGKYGNVDTDPVHYENCRNLFEEHTDQDPVHYQKCHELFHYGKSF